MKKNIVRIFLVMFFTAGLTSCGLDTFYLLNPPLQGGEKSELNILNNDPSYNYVEFYTNGSQNLASDFTFVGTYVYYKIYANESQVTRDIEEISSVNNSSNYGQAFSKLEAKGFRILRTDTSEDNGYVFSDTGSNRKVRIRLTDYANSSDINPDPKNFASIYIDDVSMGITPRRCVRNRNVNYKFSFGNRNVLDNCDLPDSGDSDFDNATPVNNMYYVDMYAVSSGYDVTRKSYYSNPLHLGVIKINASSDRNW